MTRASIEKDAVLNLPGKITAVCLGFALTAVSMCLHAFDVSPRTAVGIEGGEVSININLNVSDWEYNPPNCNRGQWGVPIDVTLYDGSAVWGQDLAGDYVSGITGVCSSVEICEPTTIPLSISLIDDAEFEGPEEASIEFRSCTGSCQYQTVTVSIQDDDVPDLEVSRIRLSDATLSSGQSFTITATIENEGQGGSPSFDVMYLISSDNVITENDGLLDMRTGQPLGAGASRTVSAEVGAPGSSGTYYVGVCAEELYGEPDYRNNCSWGEQISVSEDESCRTDSLSCGQQVSGSVGLQDCDRGPLGTDHYARIYSVQGEAGQTAWFGADWTFDGYLLLENSDGYVVSQNDNFTSTANSQIEYTFDENGTYALWLSSYAPNETGDYQLSMDCDLDIGPDLRLNMLAETTPFSLPAESIYVETEVTNAGGAASTSSVLRWMLSSDSVISPEDTQIASQTASALEAGSSRVESERFPAPATPGVYWLGACIDPVSSEAATSNNCSDASSLTVYEPPSCSSAELTCGAEIAGTLNLDDCASSPRGAGYYAEKFTIAAGQGNALKLRADWSRVDGYLYLVDPDGKVVARNDDNIDSKEPQSLIEHIPDQSGVYTLWATTFGRNQSGAFDLVAECGTSTGPDLIARASLVGGSGVTVGEKVTVSYTVTNIGGGPADGTTVLLYLSNDPVISLTDSLLVTDEIGPLAANQSVTGAIEVTVPSDPGDYWIGPCAQSVAGETVIGNNCTASSAQTQQLQSSTGKKSFLQNEDDGGLLLSVSSGAACNSQGLSCGQSQQGTLQASDCDTGPRGTGYVSDAFTFNGNAGQTITLDAKWTGVDGYLYLENPSGLLSQENDDFEDKSKSRIELVLEQSGSYTVWPTAFGQDDSGSYELQLICNQPVSPDLEVDQPVLSATSLRPGQSLGIETHVRNKGGSEAEAGSMDFILAADSSLVDGRVLQSNQVPPLSSGQSTPEATLVELITIPGTYYVGTCVDVDPNELDSANNCKASGPITVEQTSQPIPINAGLNDAWYNPANDGQGFFINVFPDNNHMFLSWFTFDTERPPDSVPYQLGDPGHRWLTAQGGYDQGVANLAVSLTGGGVFDASEPTPSLPAPYGNMTVSFSDCNNGLINYDLTEVGEAGSIPITRVVSENIAVCEESLGGVGGARNETGNDNDSAFNYNASLNDAWYNPATAGQGFFFNVYPGLKHVFVSWFTFDVQRPPEGTPFNLGEPGHRWLTAQGPFDGNTANLTVSSTGGGVFNGGSLPANSTAPVGRMTATFENCNSGVVNYTIDSIGRQGQVPIERIDLDTVPACEQQSKDADVSQIEGVEPVKDTMENMCGGSVDWRFDWPDVEGASYYMIQLYRNDSLAGSPRATGLSDISEFEYAGKEAQIRTEHLNNWKWRYRSILSFGRKGRAGWSPFYEFNVRPPDNPCAE
jgi:hypothetical protein